MKEKKGIDLKIGIVLKWLKIIMLLILGVWLIRGGETVMGVILIEYVFLLMIYYKLLDIELRLKMLEEVKD